MTSACIERFPQAYAFPRAVHFDDEIARLFQSVGLDPETNPAVQPFDQPYRWGNADKEILLELDWHGLGPSGLARQHFFYQPDLEREIDAIVATEPRAQVLRGWEAVDVVQDDDGATVLARPFEAGPDAETRTFRGRYVVGADGANSFVRSRMDVTTTDLGFEFDWLIVDMLLHEPLAVEQRAWQWCRPERPTTVIPGGAPHRQRWEFMRLPGETIEELSSAETAWRLVGEFGITPENAVLERHVVYTFRARWCRPVARRAAAPRGRRRAPDAAVRRPGHVCRPPRRRESGVEARRRPRRNGPRFPARHLRPGAPRARPALHRALRESRPGHLRDRPGGGRRSRRPAESRPRTPRARSPAAAASAPRGRPDRQPSAGRLPVLPGAGDRRRGQRPVRRRPRLRLDRPGPARRLRPLPAETRAWAEGYGVRFVEVGEGAPVSDDEGTYTAWFDELAPTRSSSAPTSTCTTPAPPETWTPLLRRLRAHLGAVVAVA